jgi:hypothetical protein
MEFPKSMMPNLRFRLLAALAACTMAPILAHCSSSSAPDPGFNSSSSSSGGRSSSGSGSGSSGASSGVGTSSGAPEDDSSLGDDDSGNDSGMISVGDQDADPSCGPNVKYPQTTFVNLAVPMGTPVTKGQSDMIPGDAGLPAVPGWDFHQGGTCRDGTPAGFFVHFAASSSDKLYIYLEGGGACDSATFCSHNPPNIATVFSGGAPTQGQTIPGSLLFSQTGQVPYTVGSGGMAGYSPGIFDFTNAANPFKDWNAVYVPYCTGDVHFGTKDDVDIPAFSGLPDLPHQHFVGGLNLKSYISKIVPTFPNMSQVLLTGASAGGFGAGLNYGMVQDSFNAMGSKPPVVVIDDSGPPFSAQYLPACLQKQWRDLWGFNDSLPSDCTECNQADGSGLTDVVYYWLHKYPAAKVGIVSTMQDEVIRLFFSQELNSCASSDATVLTLGQALCGGYTCDMYTAGLNDLLSTFKYTGRLATYFIGGTNPMYMNPSYHQHIFRNEFYQAIDNSGTMTMAQWASDFISGKLENVGP